MIPMAGWLLVLVVLLLGPAAMLAGILFPPSTQYGPNAALGDWIPGILIGVSMVVIAVQTRREDTYRALRLLRPYLVVMAFATISLFWTPDVSTGSRVLLQMLVLAPVFVAAWPITIDQRGRVALRWLAITSVGALWALFLLAWFADLLGRGDLARLMGIVTLGLPPLFVLATYAHYSTSRTTAIGAAVMGLALASDARMVAIVLAILIVTSPSLDVSRMVRAGIAAIGLLAVLGVMASSGLPVHPFYFDEGGSVSGLGSRDASLLEGREVVWSEVWGQCSDRWFVGNGIGASSFWSLEANSAFPDPHNEYLRTACDLGIPVAAVFWLFLVLVGIQAAQRVVNRLRPSASGVAALQVLLALGLLSATDIPLTASGQFLAPLAVILAWSQRASTSENL